MAIVTAKTFGRTKNENTAQNLAAVKSASYGLSVFDGWFHIGEPDELKKLGCDIRPFHVKPVHSPGPWEVSGDCVVSAPIPCRNPKAGERRDTICKIGWNFDGDTNRTGDLLWREAVPNMVLIAAAPSLLEFAREMQSYLTMKLDGWRRVDGLPENHAIVATAARYLEQCRAAISQAVQVKP